MLGPVRLPLLRVVVGQGWPAAGVPGARGRRNSGGGGGDTAGDNGGGRRGGDGAGSEKDSLLQCLFFCVQYGVVLGYEEEAGA